MAEVSEARFELFEILDCGILWIVCQFNCSLENQNDILQKTTQCIIDAQYKFPEKDWRKIFSGRVRVDLSYLEKKYIYFPIFNIE